MAKKKEDLGSRFYKIIEMLFRELDQEAIKADVEAMRRENPKASREKLAKEMTTRAAKKTAFVGASAGVPGGAFGLLAAAPDIFNLVRSQSRLVLSIAFLYEQKPGLEERFREVLAVLAMSTGASATRQGVRYLITRGLTGATAEAIMKRVAGKFIARKLPAIAPVVGSVAGAGLNYMAVQATGRIAVEYYSSELERTGRDPGAPKTAPVKPRATKASARKSSKKGTSKRSSSKAAGSKKTSRKASAKTSGSSKKKGDS